MSLSETSSPHFVLPLGSPEGWGGAAPSPIAGLFVGTLRRTGQEPLQQSPSTSSQSGKWDMVQVFLGGACQTSSDAWVPGHVSPLWGSVPHPSAWNHIRGTSHPDGLFTPHNCKHAVGTKEKSSLISPPPSSSIPPGYKEVFNTKLR